MMSHLQMGFSLEIYGEHELLQLLWNASNFPPLLLISPRQLEHLAGGRVNTLSYILKMNVETKAARLLAERGGGKSKKAEKKAKSGGSATANARKMSQMTPTPLLLEAQGEHHCIKAMTRYLVW